MNQLLKNKGTGKQKRKDGIMTAGLMAYLISFIFRIPLTYIIGDKGIGFFATGMEVFLIISIFISYSFSKAVSMLIRYRVKREMYKSAEKVFHNSMVLCIVIGGIFAVGLLFFAEFFAKNIIHEPLGYLSIIAVVPGVFCAAIMGVLKGYFQGMGSAMPSIHSKYIEKILMLASGLLAAYISYRYGLKAAALLNSDNYGYAYGAMGAALGISIAAILATVHLLLIYAVYAVAGKGKQRKDGSKQTEGSGQIIITLLTTAAPYGALALLFNLNHLVGQGVYSYAMDLNGRGATRVGDFGVYYGKYSVIVGIVAIFCTITISKCIVGVVKIYEKQLYMEAKVKLGGAIHQLVIVTIPAAVLLAVLAHPVMGVIFSGQESAAAQMLQAGSSVVIFFPLTYVMAGILQRIKKNNLVLLAGLGGFLAFILLLVVLSLNTTLGIIAVVIANVGFYLVAGGLALFFVCRYIPSKLDLIKILGVTIVASGISGMIGLLLNKLLLPFVGNIITILICLPLCVCIYLVLLIILRGVRELELEELPGGGAVIYLAKKLHLL